MCRNRNLDEFYHCFGICLLRTFVEIGFKFESHIPPSHLFLFSFQLKHFYDFDLVLCHILIFLSSIMIISTAAKRQGELGGGSLIIESSVIV